MSDSQIELPIKSPFCPEWSDSTDFHRFVNSRRAQQQEAQKGRSAEARKKEAEREALKKKKEAEARFKAEKEALFQPVHIDQKAPFGTDPKTIVCINFKNGHCKNGARCKFSHDSNAGRKVEKKDLYTDTRDAPGEGEQKKDGERLASRYSA